MTRKKKLIFVCLAVVILILGVILFAVNVIAPSDDSEETSSSSGSSGQDLDAEVKSGLTEEQEEIQENIENTIYNTTAQEEIMTDLETQKSADTYTPDNILVVYNPFGTNTQSLYIYFQTEQAAVISYTVHVDSEELENLTLESDEINDFTQTVDEDEGYQTEHEFQVIGLIPEVTNTVTFTITYEDGTSETSSITYEMGSLLGEEELQLEKTEYSESEELEDGLYVVLGNDSTQLDFMYYYDNDGILRGEVPIIGYRSHRLLFEDNTMYYSISETQIAQMNDLGQIINVFDFGDYKLHHDYVFDDDGNILVLATDTRQNTQEDIVVMLDTDTGEVTELMDLGDFFPDYKEECLERADEDDDEVDWIHVNTIQYLGDGSILLSAREVSTILKVSNIYDSPEISYMIGSEEFWEEVGYEDLLLAQDGDFVIQGGQHSITYVEDDSLSDGQYYLYMFNNNIGISNSNPDFDWASVGLTESSAKDGDASYYYMYLVDETAGTFTLVDSFEVPYSGYVSSVQNLGTHTIVDSGLTGVFSEYDENHNLIASFTMATEKFIYRVFKYELN